MPTYQFKNKKTGTVRSRFMTIAEMQGYIGDHPHIELGITTPAIVSGISTRLKPDKGFREILSNVKKRNPTGNTNDFGG